jgi:hypothetical protein
MRMSNWHDRMQGGRQAEWNRPRGFRRRDLRGNLIDDGTGYNPTAAMGRQPAVIAGSNSSRQDSEPGPIRSKVEQVTAARKPGGQAGSVNLAAQVTGRLLPQVGTALRGLARSLVSRAGSKAATTLRPASTPHPRINKLTGMPFGIEPGDAGYHPRWHDATRATHLATGVAGTLSPIAGGVLKGFRELAPRLVASAAKAYKPKRHDGDRKRAW